MRIEMIFRHSTVADTTFFWQKSGRTPNSHTDGQAVFENVKNYIVENGIIQITMDTGEIYIYNVSDFYRFKIIE